MSDRTPGDGSGPPVPNSEENNSIEINDYSSVAYTLKDTNVEPSEDENGNDELLANSEETAVTFDPEYPTPAQADYHRYAQLSKELKRRGSTTSSLSDESRSPLPQRRKHSVDHQILTGGRTEGSGAVVTGDGEAAEGEETGKLEGAGGLLGKNVNLWESSLASPPTLQWSDNDPLTKLPLTSPIYVGTDQFANQLENFITPTSPIGSLTGNEGNDNSIATPTNNHHNHPTPPLAPTGAGDSSSQLSPEAQINKEHQLAPQLPSSINSPHHPINCTQNVKNRV